MGKFAKMRAAAQRAEKLEQNEDAEMPSEESSSSESESENVEEDEPKRESKWTNRERVLVFCSRGADFRARHIMNDIKTLMPHSKGESKMEKSAPMNQVNEIALMKNCTKAIFFESRKHKDLYMWMTNVGDGPSAKFLMQDVHTMKELKMTGNVLKGSRPILSFDAAFDKEPHLALIKQMFTQTFSTPNHHPRSQPFIDHVFSFSVTPDHRIHFRNFQIVDDTLQLQEAGPRFVLHVDKIFSGSFEGEVLYENPAYVSPASMRRIIKQQREDKFASRKQQEERLKMKKVKVEEALDEFEEDPVGEIYDTERDLDDKEAVSLLRRMDSKITKRTRKSKVAKRPILTNRR